MCIRDRIYGEDSYDILRAGKRKRKNECEDRSYTCLLYTSWDGSLEVPGRLCSVQKCFNSFGQELCNVTEKSCEFHMTTYMSTTTGHWMGPSTVVKEGFVFEVEGKPEDEIVLKVDRYVYRFTLKELMKSSRILAQ